mgnify:CR=1 FL=1
MFNFASRRTNGCMAWGMSTGNAFNAGALKTKMWVCNVAAMSPFHS